MLLKSIILLGPGPGLGPTGGAPTPGHPCPAGSAISAIGNALFF
jgi:hypothetical protein